MCPGQAHFYQKFEKFGGHITGTAGPVDLRFEILCGGITIAFIRDDITRIVRNLLSPGCRLEQKMQQTAYIMATSNDFVHVNLNEDDVPEAKINLE